jgi:hypothetical protein
MDAAGEEISAEQAWHRHDSTQNSAAG